ncbi:DUF924 domain-containing protein [Sphingomonas sp. RP10(2022)]|uniref:DUF924 domain-containing protein n=1 Tax=Sphingomonas liriopis TaxID=2949094 RepID=A0A9X2KQC6_9SPHN|nr:DUF924 family protein [Sphingomonas liriopis]MCP3734411.1 DUF924 domain-containing protein [Sphingomonas liriopis]
MAATVLDFWFGLTSEQQFAKDDALDRTIAERFGAMRDGVLRARAEGWRDDPDTLLAAIILLDQFSRNLHRGSAEAFAADGLARELTHTAIGQGWESHYPPERRVFLYMPLMHAEDLAEQDLSVAKFEALGIAENIAFARDHRDVIVKYGRFPSRNAALGRESTKAEQAYLAQPDAGW